VVFGYQSINDGLPGPYNYRFAASGPCCSSDHPIHIAIDRAQHSDDVRFPFRVRDLTREFEERRADSAMHRALTQYSVAEFYRNNEYVGGSFYHDITRILVSANVRRVQRLRDTRRDHLIADGFDDTPLGIVVRPDQRRRECVLGVSRNASISPQSPSSPAHASSR
jgi:hypothetical protein